MRFVRGFVGVLVLLAPTGLGALCIFLFRNRHADVAYFEAVAQIIPILILALAIEARYLSPRGQLVKMVTDFYSSPFIGRLYVYTYTLLTFLFVVTSEGVALSIVASQKAEAGALGLTAGGLLAGMVALVTSVLIPAKDEDQPKTGRRGRS